MFNIFRNAKAVATTVQAPVHKPVFVIGCGRSGTTLLFNMLKEHPELAPTTGHPDGEDHVGWNTHGGTIISGIYGHAGVGDTGHVVGYHFCPHMNEQDLDDATRESMHRYYSEEVLRGRKELRVVNKCPHLSNKLRYVQAIFPDALFIHLVRNPVAMVASWINIMKDVPDLLLYWPEAEYPCFWVLEERGAMKRGQSLQRESRIYPGGGLLLFADYWAETNGNVSKQLGETSPQLLTVNYEKLIENPMQEITRITDFCGLAPMAAMPLQIDKARNSMRRDLLTSENVAAIRERVKAVAPKFGYTWPQT